MPRPISIAVAFMRRQDNPDRARADFTAVLTTSDKYANSRGAKDLARGRLKVLTEKK